MGYVFAVASSLGIGVAAATGVAVAEVLLFLAVRGSSPEDAEEFGFFIVFVALPLVILTFLCAFCLAMGRATSRMANRPRHRG